MAWAILIFCSAFACFAQADEDAVLRGRVIFANGKPVGSASIELQMQGDGDAVGSSPVTAKQIGGQSGSFVFLRIAPGVYRVHASDPAEPRRAVSQDITLAAGEAVETILTLPLDPILQLAMPQAPTPAQDATHIGTQEISDLPALDRQWESFAALLGRGNDATPAAAEPGEEQDGSRDATEATRRGGTQDGATSPSSGLSYAGLPPTQNAESIDGLSAQQSFRSGPRGSAAGGPVSGTSFSEGALRSMRVQPHTFTALDGNAAGGLFAVRTRTGTGSLHGTGFYLLRESAFAATNPFSTVTHDQNGTVTSSLVKPQDTLQQFGGTIGLPLGSLSKPHGLRRPLLFASVEEQLRSNPAISTPANPAFYSLSPTQVALLLNRGVTAQAQSSALNYLDSLSGPVDRSSTRLLAFLRADTNITRRDRLTLSYSANRFNSPSGTGFEQSSDAVIARGRGSVGDRLVHVDAVAAHWLHTFSPRVDHELRFQWARDLESEQPRTPLAQEPAISPGGFAPQVSIEPDGFAYGTPAGLGRSAYPDEHRLQVADDLRWSLGHHLLTLGGDWSRMDDRIAQLEDAEGSFLYDSGATNGRAGGLADWITDYTFNVHAYPNGGCPSINATVHDFCFRSFTQSFGTEQTQFVTHEIAGLAEDSFKARASLAFTLGARYEYTLLPLPQDPNPSLDAAFSSLTGPLSGSTSSFPEDRNNFGPRASATWTPAHGRFGTWRLGYGLFFGRLTGATIHAALIDTALPATTTHIRITPTTETLCPQVANQGFGYPCAYIAAPPAAVLQTSSATLFSAGFRLPTVQRGSFGLERSLGRHFILRAEYAGSVATQLPGTTDINIAPATGTRSYVVRGGDGYPGLHTGQTFTVPLYTARRAAQYGPVTTVLSNVNASYHSGTLEAQVRGLRELTLRGSFTFSRAIDYAPQLSATPRLNGQFDPFRNGYDKGLSSLNFPQRFTGEAVYHPEFRRGSLAFRKAANGWRVAAVAFAGSGAPYSYAVFGGTRLSGGRESINGAGGATYLPTVGRNTLRLPPRGSVDLRLSREWGASGLRVTAFAEAFNLLNERNLSRVETRAFLLGTPATDASPTPLVFQDAAAVAAEGITTRPFGAPTSSTTGLSRERQAELGVRLVF